MPCLHPQRKPPIHPRRTCPEIEGWLPLQQVPLRVRHQQRRAPNPLAASIQPLDDQLHGAPLQGDADLGRRWCRLCCWRRRRCCLVGAWRSLCGRAAAAAGRQLVLLCAPTSSAAWRRRRLGPWRREQRAQHQRALRHGRLPGTEGVRGFARGRPVAWRVLSPPRRCRRCVDDAAELAAQRDGMRRRWPRQRGGMSRCGRATAPRPPARLQLRSSGGCRGTWPLVCYLIESQRLHRREWRGVEPRKRAGACLRNSVQRGPALPCLGSPARLLRLPGPAARLPSASTPRPVCRWGTGWMAASAAGRRRRRACEATWRRRSGCSGGGARAISVARSV